MTARSRNKIRQTGRKPRRDSEYHTDARLRALTENLTDSITVVDRAGTILYDNPTMHSILGNPSPELVGRNAFELVHPDDLPSARRLFRDLLRKPGTTRTAELRLRHRDRSWRAVEVVGKNLLANPAVAGIVLTARDINGRKQAEAALRKSEERFRLFMDNSPTIVWVKDERGRHVYLNKTYEKRFGVRLKDWRGKTDQEV